MTNARWAAIAVVVVALVASVAAQTVSPGLFSYLRLGSSSATKVSTGTGTPEAAVTGAVGDLFLRTDGAAGTVLYIKESGTGNTGWSTAGAVTASSTTTFTNKTIDAEGTLNVITIPFTQYIRAAECNNATPTASEWSFPTSNPAVPACQTGTNTQYGTLDFADGANILSAQTVFRLPNDWTGNIGAKLEWFTSGTSGFVLWTIQTICVADAETTDPAFNAVSGMQDATKGTTLQLNAVTSSSITITGCAAGELLYLKVARDPTSGSDTTAATARLVGLELTYRRAI